MRKVSISRINAAGFALAEVLAAVVIAGTALTVLLLERNRTVQSVAETDSLRLATMLASEKMGEILVGEETAGAGAFPQHDGYRWEVSGTQAVFGTSNNQVTCPIVELTVNYDDGRKSVTLRAVSRRGR